MSSGLTDGDGSVPQENTNSVPPGDPSRFLTATQQLYCTPLLPSLVSLTLNAPEEQFDVGEANNKDMHRTSSQATVLHYNSIKG